jgi:hypothetical protein
VEFSAFRGFRAEDSSESEISGVLQRLKPQIHSPHPMPTDIHRVYLKRTYMIAPFSAKLIVSPPATQIRMSTTLGSL